MISGEMCRRALLAPCLILCASTAQAGETVTYIYDALGRLVTAQHSGGPNSGASITYDHDVNGNRNTVTVSGVPMSGAPTSVVNGSFESPSMNGGYAYRNSITPPTGMSFSGNAGLTANATAWGFPNAPDGSQIAFLQSGDPSSVGAVTQTVTGLTVGTSYKVNFWAVYRPGHDATNVSVSVGGSPLGTFNLSPGFQPFSSAAFTATGTSASITFRTAQTGSDTATGLDQVTVTLASVPMPTVANASFENPVVTGYSTGFTYNPSVSGQTFQSVAGISSNNSAFAFAAAPDGNQTGFVQSSADGYAGTMTQDVSGLVSGQAYRLSFSAATRPNYPGNPLDVSIGGATTSVTPGNSFATYALVFTATNATTAITYAARNSGQHGASAIDSVSVTPQ